MIENVVICIVVFAVHANATHHYVFLLHFVGVESGGPGGHGIAGESQNCSKLNRKNKLFEFFRKYRRSAVCLSKLRVAKQTIFKSAEFGETKEFVYDAKFLFF
jgi:hypothetical protein